MSKLLFALTACFFLGTSASPITPDRRVNADIIRKPALDQWRGASDLLDSGVLASGGRMIVDDPIYGTASTVAYGRGSLSPNRTPWSPTYWIYPAAKKSQLHLHNCTSCLTHIMTGNAAAKLQNLKPVAAKAPKPASPTSKPDRALTKTAETNTAVKPPELSIEAHVISPVKESTSALATASDTKQAKTPDAATTSSVAARTSPLQPGKTSLPLPVEDPEAAPSEIYILPPAASPDTIPANLRASGGELGKNLPPAQIITWFDGPPPNLPADFDPATIFGPGIYTR
jgi:hypothetical protein